LATSGASKSSSKASKKKASSRKAIDAPFDAKVLKKAEQVARTYRIIIEPEEDWYYGSTVELPFVMGDGETIEGCVTMVMEATVAALATMIEKGERTPAPASAGKRDQQVNIRLTAHEKFRLEQIAQREGFRSLSDFIRTAAMQRAS